MAAHTTYTVFVDGAIPGDRCDPTYPFSFQIGTFTTVSGLLSV